jgi:hypothetical protein
MVRVLKDIGVDIPALGLIEEAPVDYDGVDILVVFQAGLADLIRRIGLDNHGMKWE